MLRWSAVGGPRGGDDAALGNTFSVAEFGTDGFDCRDRLGGRCEREDRLGVDHALPLSDHADYDQLIETVRKRRAEGDFLHAWPGGIRGAIVSLGFNAYPLQASLQRRLF